MTDCFDNVVVSVAVENLQYHFDSLFDYRVSHDMAELVMPGKRVVVPFGSGNKSRIAMIMQVKYTYSGDISTLKAVKSVQDKEPLLSAEMLDLAMFMAKRYFCTLYDCIKIMLPAGINYKFTKGLKAIDNVCERELSQLQQDVFFAVKNAKKPISEAELYEVFGEQAEDAVNSLINIGAISRIENPIRIIGDALVKSIRLTELDSDGVKLTPKQREVVELLKVSSSASVKEICYYTGVTPAVTDALVKKNLAEYFEEEVFRIPKDGNTVIKQASLVLSSDQTRVYNELLEKYLQDKPQVSLLYGVTGSGKTSVFMQLIDKALQDDRGIIVMVPEISLTPQLIGIFKGRYGNKTAVFHSGLSMGERLDEWKRVKKGEAKIAVGTRSAIFAPFDDVGLIIMDEEQEHTYKSDSTPKFHTRDLAKFRCSKHNALLLLASATPSVESMYYAKSGRYSLSTLNKRFGTAVLPEVVVADMNTEIEQGNRTMFSTPLLEALENTLDEGKQAIILLNRRGHNTFVSCRSCGKTANCPNCSISMTYHSANNRLMCHYCGYSINYNGICPDCNAKSLRLSGTGTQRAEGDLSEIFPNARILRLDADSTMKKYSHEEKLSAFASGEYDILLGTQMVAKGLDFPNVTLVGVLSADQVLYGNDYRSYERAFSLLTQVVGRSGRGKYKGKAVIQTFTPENPVIMLSSMQDYDSFYESDIKIRKAMLYPPFSDLCMLSFSSLEREKAENASILFAQMLCSLAREKYKSIPLRVLGPSAAAILRINGRYRYKIILKSRNNNEFRTMMSELLKEAGRSKNFRDVYVNIDIAPESIM